MEIFDKPARFVGAGSTTVRFDEFAAAIRLHDASIRTKRLHLLFDKMDSDRGGSVGFAEFLAFWSTLKLDLFPDDGVKDTEAAIKQVRNDAKARVFYYLPILNYCKKDTLLTNNQTNNGGDGQGGDGGSKQNGNGSIRDLFLYSIFYMVFCLTVLFKRQVLPEYHFTKALQEKLEWNGKFGDLGHMTFEHVTNRDDVWDWLEGPVSETFINRGGNSYTRALEVQSGVDKVTGVSDRVVGTNELIPSILRLRQLRVAGKSCEKDVREAQQHL